MIQIFLNDTPVYIKDGAAVKLTVENPMFDSGDSYTYDVELPLHLPANRDFFGSINRIDVSKKYLKYSARLVADNRTLLTGDAVLLQVTDTVAKVQLLGSGASLNFQNSADGRYIDELDLGDFATDTWPTRYTEPVRGTAYGYAPAGDILPAAYATSGECGWVAYPVENSTAEVICNEWRIMETSAGAGKYAWEWEPKHSVRDNEEQPPCIVSPQPFLWFMAKKIAAATGVNLPDDDNILLQDDLLKRIFIVNASGYAQWNRALPHWTVNEWWQELQNAFGVVLTVDAGGNGRAVPRTAYYNSESSVTYIDKVADEFTVDVNDDTEADVSTSNVGYADFDADAIDLLDEGVINSARFIDDFDSLEAIADYADSLEDKWGWLDSVRDVIFRCKDGHQYIYFANFEEDYDYKPLIRPCPAIREVNIYRPRMANSESSEVEKELRFVPCKLVEYEPTVMRKSDDRHPGAQGAYPVVGTGTPVPILSRPDREETARLSEDAEGVILEDIINGDAEAVDKDATGEEQIYVALQPDVCEYPVSFAVNGNLRSATYPCPTRPLRRSWDVSGSFFGTGSKYALTLNRSEGIKNVYTSQIAEGVQIDTRVKQCIKFYSKEVPDVSSVFVIRNKKFACAKLEVNITAQGIDNIITGYFYEMEL